MKFGICMAMYKQAWMISFLFKESMSFFKRLITLFKLPQMDHTLIMRYIYNVQYIKNKILITDSTIYHGSLVN
jgi:IS4 transposase